MKLRKKKIYINEGISMYMDGKTQYFQISILLNLAYVFSTTSIKIPTNSFCEMNKLIIPNAGKNMEKLECSNDVNGKVK